VPVWAAASSLAKAASAPRELILLASCSLALGDARENRQ
jgi:hypothetical protein